MALSHLDVLTSVHRRVPYLGNTLGERRIRCGNVMSKLKYAGRTSSLSMHKTFGRIPAYGSYALHTQAIRYAIVNTRYLYVTHSSI